MVLVQSLDIASYGTYLWAYSLQDKYEENLIFLTIYKKQLQVTIPGSRLLKQSYSLAQMLK